MKKYIIIYIILFAILLVMGLTHGIPFGITISVVEEPFGILPKTNKHIVLIYNIVIMLGCMIATIIVTRKKDNTIPLKWLVPIVMLGSFVFLPVGMSKHFLVAPKETIIQAWSLISLAMR